MKTISQEQSPCQLKPDPKQNSTAETQNTAKHARCSLASKGSALGERGVGGKG